VVNNAPADQAAADLQHSVQHQVATEAAPYIMWYVGMLAEPVQHIGSNERGYVRACQDGQRYRHEHHSQVGWVA